MGNLLHPSWQLLSFTGSIPWDAATINELYKTKVDIKKQFEFMDYIIDEKRDLLVRDLCVEGAVWTGSHPKNYTIHQSFLTLQGKIWFHFVNYRLKPSTHSTTVTLDKMCLINSIVKGRKIDVGAILHQEIADCVVRQTGILVFPSLVMLLYQQREIVPRAGEKVLENKGLINKASVKRMTRDKDTRILKEAETSKIRKSKAKANRKGTNLNTKTSLWRKLKDVKKCLFEDGIFADQEDTVVEKEVAIAEEEVVAKEEEVIENEKEKEKEDSFEKIVPHPSLEEQCNSLAIVVYPGPLQVASLTQTTVDDVRVELGTEEQSEGRAKPKEKNMKCFKEKKMRRKKHHEATSKATDN
ncbi:hypothetical protein PVK06_024159 [Gossypium arboreum]|uniref:Putative plant transposon protein domain-containing protein n=1 Tax=Gossypium arboreum TaxID=29729 RepID=A0ABR0PDF7_GOSAR|nr:hypothetical protein PVK06_024159 [Gossypium arboreum]